MLKIGNKEFDATRAATIKSISEIITVGVGRVNILDKTNLI